VAHWAAAVSALQMGHQPLATNCDVVWCLDAWADLRARVATRLPPWARLRVYDPAQGSLEAQVAGAHVLIPTTGRVDASVIRAAAPTLRLIVQPASGVENIDLQTASDLNIRVIACPGVNAAACAEASIMGLLLAARRWKGLAASVEAGLIGTPPGTTLAGKRLGVVGLGGAIGSRVGRAAAGMGMDVVGWGAAASAAGGRPGFAAWLSSLDALSLHCPLTPATEALVDAAALGAAKPGLILVNFSRGRVVDEAALLGALESGRVGAAALDVFCVEPVDPASPLAAHPRVVVTPHCGVATEEVYDEYARRLVDAIEGVQEGRELGGRVA
jgi:phosphoglycerate dehydrogenase-like enzyme